MQSRHSSHPPTARSPVRTAGRAALAIGRTARLDLPARLLRAADYELIVEGRSRAGAYEEAGDYYFTVAPRR